MDTRPLVAGSSPSKMRMNVLLPAPLAPTNPMTPGSISTVSASRASTPGNRLVSSWARIKGKGFGVLGIGVLATANGEPRADRLTSTPPNSGQNLLEGPTTGQRRADSFGRMSARVQRAMFESTRPPFAAGLVGALA